jgi:5-methylcytosine-specific restriction endonuclease McrA
MAVKWVGGSENFIEGGVVWYNPNIAFTRTPYDPRRTAMSSDNTPSDRERQAQLVAEARRNREHTYREKALKLYPWICARCGREFSGKKLRELTVHHKDHNHDNNPPDGSNWELLCIYCHDNEHARYQTADAYDNARSDHAGEPSSGFRPFAGLEDLLKNKK